jgi:RHS repeat-associated protein
VVGLHDLANGNVVERYAYDMTGNRTIYAANGTTVRTTSSFGNHFGYTSRWHDAESGLINFRARHYNPLTGEFLRRDPLGFEDGMSLYRGYMELGWLDPTGTVKIACGCRARGNKGRKIEAEVECKGSFETCCEEACGKAGRYVWDGQPSRIVHRPEFDATNGAPSIGRSDYTPSYWRDYFLTWRSPHPHDPVDLWLTRGKIGAGGVFVVAGGTVVAIKTGVISAVAHYGKSAYYWAWANSGYVPVAATTGASLANGALGVVDPLPDATDIGMAGKPIREAVENVPGVTLKTLYHFRSKLKPPGPRLSDFGAEAISDMVPAQSLPLPKGISMFDDLLAAPLSGHYHMIPPVPFCLKAHASLRMA